MYGIRVINSPEKAPISQIGIALVTDWNAVGSFPNPDHKGHDTVYPPERAINLTDAYEGMDGQVRWKVISESGNIGYVDLCSHFSPNSWSTAYALNYLWADSDINVQLRVGSNDAIKIWLDGALIHDFGGERGAQLDEDIVSVSLKAGWTPVLLKVSQTEGGWGFYFRVTDTGGTPVKSVRCALKPE